MATEPTESSTSKHQVSRRSGSIIHVAKLAKVSPATVARAFSGTAPVAEKTRDIIMTAARELGYHPNLLARGLRGGRTKTIGILWSLCGPHSAQSTIETIALKSNQRGYVTYIADSLSHMEVTKRALIDFAQRHVDGIVLQWGYFRPLDNAIATMLKNFPASVVVTPVELEVDLNQIHFDRLQAIRDMADHFAKIGRRRPAMFMSNGNEEKAQAFLYRMRFHGLDISHDYCIGVESAGKKFSGQIYYDALEQRFPTGRPEMDCLFCGTDEGAAAAIQWLQRRGLRVPQDVAVAGFNDSDFAKFVNPPLASVDRCEDEICDILERMLFEDLENSDQPCRREKVSMRFVWRESAG